MHHLLVCPFAKQVTLGKGLRRDDVEDLSLNKVSKSTLWRIEIGRGNAKIDTLIEIAKVLKVNVSELVADIDMQSECGKNDSEPACIVDVDIYDCGVILEDMASQKAEDECSDEGGISAEEYADTYKRCLEYITTIQRLIYPCLPPSKEIVVKTYQSYHIRTLAQFIVYMPLMHPEVLSDVFQRLEGEIFGNEDYFLTQMEHAYKSIPDSPAKVYADFLARRLTYETFVRAHYDIYGKICNVEEPELISNVAVIKNEYLMNCRQDYCRRIKDLRLSFGDK